MTIKNHSTYLLQTALTQICTLLLNQFLCELFEIIEQCLSTDGRYGKARQWVDLCVGCALKHVSEHGGFWIPCLQAAAVKPV